jgi:glycosyltransferase involved in cell wall biosynthesis
MRAGQEMRDLANPKKLRLCYLADLHSFHTQRWASYFAKKGHSVVVLSPTQMEIPGVRVRALFWRPGFPKIFQLANVFLVLAVLRTFKPHVLHAHFVRFYGWLAALSSFKPLVITVWGGDILGDQGAFSDLLGRKLTPFALKKADIVTAHSRFLKQRVVELGKQESRVRLVGCPGVDRKQFRPGLDTYSLRRELGIGAGSVVLCTRLINPLYNTEIVLKAISLVLKEAPATKFIFSEHGGDKVYIQQMKAFARELGVENSILFFEEIPHDRMPLFLNLAEVFVSIPDSDGMPQSLLEAMSCGTVPVVSNLRQYDEVVRKEANALVVQQKDARAVARAILILLKDAALRETLSKACLDTIMEGMDYEVEMEKMEKLYYELSKVGDREGGVQTANQSRG